MSNPTPESTYHVPQAHAAIITALLTENGPMAASGIIHHLFYERDDDVKIPLMDVVLASLLCPGTWRIDISDDMALVGLDSQPKPGDGSVEAAAAYIGLQWLDTGDESGCWVPARA